MHSLRHVHELALDGEDVRSRAQVFVLLVSEVEQQITVGLRGGVDERFVSKASVVWVELFRQVCELAVVARILKSTM